MFISASRRTDIPALYSEWMLNRLRQGVVLVRNPYNPRQVTQVNLAPSVVDCLVFWTKNPGPMLPLLGEIEQLGFHFYFQFTLTPYPADLERGLPDKPFLVALFQDLARRTGPERVLWRYDPIFFTDTFTPGYHVECFTSLARQLRCFTHRCTISFITMYEKCRRNLQGSRLMDIDDEEKVYFIRQIAAVAHKNGMQLEACTDSFLHERCSIPAARCIDDRVLSTILGRRVQVDKATGQRAGCGCVDSVDIGAYNSCTNGCRYCYANTSALTADRNRRLHDPQSPLVIGRLTGEETVTVKSMRSCLSPQGCLF